MNFARMSQGRSGVGHNPFQRFLFVRFVLNVKLHLFCSFCYVAVDNMYINRIHVHSSLYVQHFFLTFIWF